MNGTSYIYVYGIEPLMGGLFRFTVGPPAGQAPVFGVQPDVQFTNGIPSAIPFNYPSGSPTININPLGLPSTVTINASTFVYNGANATSISNAVLVASNAFGAVSSNAFAVNVALGAHAPVWSSSSFVSLPAGGTFNLNTICTDADVGDQIAYTSLVTIPPGFSLNGPTGLVNVSSNVSTGAYSERFRGTDLTGRSADSSNITFSILSTSASVLGTFFNNQSLTLKPTDQFDIVASSWISGQSNVSYSLIASNLNLNTWNIGAYSSTNVPSWLSISASNGMIGTVNAPVSVEPGLLVKVGQTAGTTTVYTGPIHVCIYNPAPISWQIYTNFDNASSAALYTSTVFPLDPNPASLIATTGCYIVGTAGRFSYNYPTTRPIDMRANKALHFRCLTGSTGGKIVFAPGGPAAVGWAGDSASAPVNALMTFRDFWCRDGELLNDNVGAAASPSNTPPAFSALGVVCNSTQSMQIQDCIIENYAFGQSASNNFGSTSMYNNLTINVGSVGGIADLHMCYPHGVYFEFIGNNMGMTRTYLDLPFGSFNGTNSMRRRQPVGHLVKTRCGTNYILANKFMGERGSYTELIDLANDGVNYVDDNILWQGQFAGQVWPYTSTTQTNNKVVGFGSQDPSGTPWGTPQLYMRQNTEMSAYNASENFVRMISQTGGNLAVTTAGADPLSSASQTFLVNTSTDVFTAGDNNPANPNGNLLTAPLFNGRPMSLGATMRYNVSSGATITPLTNGQYVYMIPVQDGAITHAKVANTQLNAILGTKVNFSAATAGAITLEVAPTINLEYDNNFIGVAADSNGNALCINGSGSTFAMAGQNTYGAMSAMQDQNPLDGNFQMISPAPAQLIWTSPIGAFKYDPK